MSPPTRWASPMAPPAAALIDTLTNFTKLLKKDQWQQSAKMADTATESLNCRHTECALADPTRPRRQEQDRRAKHSWLWVAGRPTCGCCVTPAIICTVRFLLLSSTVSPRVGSSFPSEQRGKEGGREPKKKEYIYSNHLGRSKNELEDFVYFYLLAISRIFSYFQWFDKLFLISCFLFVLKLSCLRIYAKYWELSGCELTNFSQLEKLYSKVDGKIYRERVWLRFISNWRLWWASFLELCCCCGGVPGFLLRLGIIEPLFEACRYRQFGLSHHRRRRQLLQQRLLRPRLRRRHSQLQQRKRNRENVNGRALGDSRCCCCFDYYQEVCPDETLTTLPLRYQIMTKY